MDTISRSHFKKSSSKKLGVFFVLTFWFQICVENRLITITWFIIKTYFDTQVWLYNGVENKSTIFLNRRQRFYCLIQKLKRIDNINCKPKTDNLSLWDARGQWLGMTTISIRNDLLWLLGLGMLRPITSANAMVYASIVGHITIARYINHIPGIMTATRL